MKIVFLDVKTLGSDINLAGFEKMGEVIRYEISAPEDVPARVTDADVLIVNKVPINEATIGTAKNLKLVCLTATGTNNLDKSYLEKKGIEWRNVAGYSTKIVAQHTFAMVFYLMEKMAYYDAYVKSEEYIASDVFTHLAMPFHELYGKTWGIIGLGAIGRKVADIAKAFGVLVIFYSTSGSNHNPDYEQVDFDTLLKKADIVSVHAPLNENTENLMNRAAFEKMKNNAIFINVGRGPIVVEADLADALEQGEIAAAGLDVLTVEPMVEDNPLKRIKDSNKLIITPHIAWASVEARNRLMKIVENQVQEYFQL